MQERFFSPNKMRIMETRIDAICNPKLNGEIYLPKKKKDMRKQAQESEGPFSLVSPTRELSSLFMKDCKIDQFPSSAKDRGGVVFCKLNKETKNKEFSVT